MGDETTREPEPTIADTESDLRYIFISYGRQDGKGFAKKLARWLRSQGYQPWLDIEKGIPVGSPFDIRIENAISTSRILIAILSPWSLREEGFCRNELLFAQCKGVPIIPVRIAEVHPPIQIISLNYIDAAKNPEDAFHELPKAIGQVEQSGCMSRREWPRTEIGTNWWADHTRLDFEEELARHGGPLTGRQWLFQQLKNGIRDPGARLLLLIGDSGVGKSAVAAHATAQLNVCGVHFCSHSNPQSCSAVTWIRELIYQLALQFPEYRGQLRHVSAPRWSDPPDALFRALVADPLRKMEKRPQQTQPCVFVIDALDESVAVSGNELPDLLEDSVERLPDWLRVIVTTRPDRNILAKFSGVKHQIIEAEGADNLEDIGIYVSKRLQNMDVAAGPREKLTQQLVSLASGNFLYAKMTLDALANADPEIQLSANELVSLPRSMTGWYNKMFRKRFADPNFYVSNVAPLLECLVASEAAIPEALLRDSSGLEERIYVQTLGTISQFLIRSVGRVRLFHRSVAEWLEKEHLSGEFYASSKAGHRRLAQACWDAYVADPQAICEYCTENTAIHLMEAGRWYDLLDFVTSPQLQIITDWIQSGKAKKGLVCLVSLFEYFQRRRSELVKCAGLATQIARIYNLWGEFGQAESWLRRSLRLTSWWKGRREKAIALHEIGSLDLYRREFGRAARLYRSSLRLCLWGWPVHRDEAAANLIGLATVAQLQNRFFRCIHYARKAMRHATAALEIRHLIAAGRLMGYSCRYLGNYKEAAAQYRTAMWLSEAHGVKLEKVRVLIHRGWLEYDVSLLNGRSTEQAEEDFKEALVEAETLNDASSIVEARIGLGWCALRRNSASEATHWFENLLEVSPTAWQKPAISTGLAHAFLLQGRFEKAVELYQRVIDSCSVTGDIVWGWVTIAGLGAVHWYSGRIEEAEDAWTASLRMAKGISKARLELAKATVDSYKTLRIP